MKSVTRSTAIVTVQRFTHLSPKPMKTKRSTKSQEWEMGGFEIFPLERDAEMSTQGHNYGLRLRLRWVLLEIKPLLRETLQMRRHM